MKKKYFFKEVYEYKDIEVKLEEMAAKGWLLRKIKGNTWCFEETEPKELNFTITIHNDEGIFDYPENTEKKPLRELCEEAGWIYAAGNIIYQVFYREDESVPIYTDDAVTFSILEKKVRKSQIPIFLLTLLFLFQAIKSFSDYYRFKDILSNGPEFYPWTFLAALSMMVYLFYSEYWLSKNSRNIKSGRGLFFFTRSQMLLKNVLVYGIIISYLILIFGNLFNQEGRLSIMIGAFTVTGIQIVILKWVIGRFKKVKRSRKKNIMIYAVSGFVLWAVSVFVMLTILI